MTALQKDYPNEVWASSELFSIVDGADAHWHRFGIFDLEKKMTELPTNWPHYVIGIVIYPGMTTLDIVGPQTVFNGLPNVDIHRIWKTLDPITGDDGMVIVPDTTFADCPPVDVICIGGGFGQSAIIDDAEILNFLKKQGDNAKFVTSVCGGSEFLAKAGLLEGYRAATHWAARPKLAELGVEVGTERVVVDRNRMTGGGVTAGIDFGLTVSKALYGEDIAKINQLLMEYDPAPPYDVGSPEKAGPELINKAMQYMAQTMGATL